MDKFILDSAGIERAVVRMAHEILENNEGASGLALVGIQTRGVILAERLNQAIEQISGKKIELGVLDIGLYRDDVIGNNIQPIIKETKIEFNIDDLTIVLVDDVLYTGRTVRSALNALVDFGRPKRIELAVLVDRGHRELPIRADFVGKNIPTNRNEKVFVRLTELDGKDEVILADQE